MTLAACLLTSDRRDMTVKTVESFVDHNDIDGMILLHADDASRDNWNFEIAHAGGFETVYANRTAAKLGAVPALYAMWNEAARRGATHILHLENDQEFVAPIPARRDAQSIRLYGEFKERGTGPRRFSGPHLMGTKTKIQWDFDGHEWQRGIAHWGGQASITESGLLVKAVECAKSLKDVSMSLQKLDTLRPRENIVWHVGHERTPGGVFT